MYVYSKENYVAIRNTNGSVAVMFYLYSYFSCLFSNISTGHRPHPNVIPIRNVVFARAKRRLRLHEYRHVRSWEKYSHIIKWSSTKATMFRKLKLQLKTLSGDVIRNSSFIQNLFRTVRFQIRIIASAVLAVWKCIFPLTKEPSEKIIYTYVINCKFYKHIFKEKCKFRINFNQIVRILKKYLV